MLRYLTAGESHGRALVGVLEGMPAGLEIVEEDIVHQLRRRQGGYGRGGRMKIESDRAKILSGVRAGRTLGTPIALMIENRDWANWKDRMMVEPGEVGPPVTVPRPGHADLAGALKYGHEDLRNVLERASARETAMRVGLGTIARKFLRAFGIEIVSYVIAIGASSVNRHEVSIGALSNEEVDRSPVRCPDPDAERAMIAEIDRARTAGDSVGGVFEVVATGVPPGLGSYAHWDRRLDGRLAQALMSIPAIKGVEVGLGIEAGRRPGSEVHDEIFWERGRYRRRTNNAGGLEGGVTNGEPVVIRATMKPIPTLRKPLRSVDMRTKAPVDAHRERSDVCAVPAASVVGEAMLAFVLADAFTEKFGGDRVEEIRRRFEREGRRLRIADCGLRNEKSEIPACAGRRNPKWGTIFLTGFMGAGKTVVGKVLAAKLGMTFVDTDEMVERAAGRSIPQIFEEEGEEGFRRIEHECVVEAAKGGRAVVALGGGAITQERNWEVIRRSGVCVWLRVDAETVFERVKEDVHRPLLAGLDDVGKLKKIRRMLEARAPFYRRADVTVVSAHRKRIEEIADEVLDMLERLRCRSFR